MPLTSFEHLLVHPRMQLAVFDFPLPTFSTRVQASSTENHPSAATTTTATSTQPLQPVRLSANFRLSTALPCSSSSSLAAPLQNHTYQQATPANSTPAPTSASNASQPNGGGWTTSQGAVLYSGLLNNSENQVKPLLSSGCGAMTTATKFECESTISAGTSFGNSASFPMPIPGWPATGGMSTASAVGAVSDWDLLGLKTAAAFGKGAIDSRLISSSAYSSNPVGNYTTGSAYPYLPQSYYSGFRTPAAGSTGGGSQFLSLPTPYFAGIGPSTNSLQSPTMSKSITDTYPQMGNSNPSSLVNSFSGYYPYADFASYAGNSFAHANQNSLGTGSLYGNGMMQHLGTSLLQQQQQYPCPSGIGKNDECSPPIPAPIPSTSTSSNLISPTIASTSRKRKGSSEKVSGGAKKSAKKRKPATNGASLGCSTSAQSNMSSQDEPDNTRVFIWELDDLCSSVLSNSEFTRRLVEQILHYGFKMNSLDGGGEMDQSHIDEANIDDSHIQDATCYGIAGEVPSSSYVPVVGNECGGMGSTTGVIKSPLELSNGAVSNHHAPITATCLVNESGAGNEISILSGQLGTTESALNRTMLETMSRVSAQYSRIRQTYDAYKQKPMELFSNFPTGVEQLKALNSYIYGSGASVEYYRRCLQLIAERSSQVKDKCTNIVLASESLCGALAKLIVFDMARHVPVENIYSVAKITREEAVKRIANRFKKKHAVMISSSMEVGLLAKKEGIPFWPVHQVNDVIVFHLALDQILLNVDLAPNSSQPTTSIAATPATIPSFCSSTLPPPVNQAPAHAQNIY